MQSMDPIFSSFIFYFCVRTGADDESVQSLKFKKEKFQNE